MHISGRSELFATGRFAACLLLVLGFVYREFLLGDQLFVFRDLGGDSYVVEFPKLYGIMASIHRGELPSWSFHTGLGQNMYPFSFEPIAWVLFRLGLTNVPAVMLILQLAYTFLAGLFFFLLLRRLNVHPMARTPGALAYAFSGYAVLSGSWIVSNFAAAGFHFAFLLWAIEGALTKRRYASIVWPVALIAVNYPVNLYFALIVAGAYIAARVYRSGWTQAGGSRPMLMMALYALIGAGISAFILLPSVYGMMLSPRGAGDVRPLSGAAGWLAESGEVLSAVLRLFHPTLAGDVAHYRLYRNFFEAPLMYSSMLILLVIPAGMTLFGRGGKRVAVVVLGILTLIMLSPVIRQAAWLKMGDYYRVLNLIAALTLTLVGSFALSAVLSANRPVIRPLLITSLVLAILPILLTSHATLPGASSPWIPACLSIVFAGLLIGARRIPPARLSGALIVVLVADVGLAAASMLQDRETFSKTELPLLGYDDRSAGIIRDLNRSDPSFFRLEKDFYAGRSWLASFNEATVQDFNGSATYGPFNNVHYTRFLTLFGVIAGDSEESSRFVTGLREHLPLRRLCSTAYFLSNRPMDSAANRAGLVAIRESEGLTLFRDSAAMPFGFCYREVVDMPDFRALSHDQRSSLAFRAVAADRHDFPQAFQLPRYKTGSAIQPENGERLTALREDTLQMSAHGQDWFQGDICLAGDRILFLSMPYDAGWRATDNGHDVAIHPVFGGLCGVYLGRGLHRLDFRYDPPWRHTGALLSILSLALLFVVYGFHFARNRKSAKHIAHL